MCFKGGGGEPAADPNAATIESEQAAQKAAAEEAKAAAQAEAAKQQQAAIEKAQAEAVSVYKAEQEAKRQAELDKAVSTEDSLAKATEEAAAAKLSEAQQKEREETLKLIQSLQTNQRSLIAAQASYMKKQTEEAEAEKDLGPVLSAAAERQKRISKFGSIATRGRASRRSGSRSRRSLITGLGGGIGYYDRFAN